jgi:hypothetical protein
MSGYDISASASASSTQGQSFGAFKVGGGGGGDGGGGGIFGGAGSSGGGRSGSNWLPVALVALLALGVFLWFKSRK